MGSVEIITFDNKSNSIIRKTGNIKCETYEQYGNNGKKSIYQYEKELGTLGEIKYVVYNINHKVVGAIKKIYDCCNCHFIFTDENNNIIYYIDNIGSGCRSHKYLFYDKNKNIDGFIQSKKECCTIIYEEFDKNNTKISSCKYNIKCFGVHIFVEYDKSGKLAFITKVFNAPLCPIIKISDKNHKEIDLTDKTLFNKGFTKIQIFIIINYFFLNKGDKQK